MATTRGIWVLEIVVAQHWGFGVTAIAENRQIDLGTLRFFESKMALIFEAMFKRR